MPSPAPRSQRPPLVFVLLAAAAVVAGIVHALHLAWTADDAYLSYRYADQLLSGHGLVFNPGERVEGYTNFLWTLWTAAGMRLGFAPEAWSNAWSIASYAGTLLLLSALSWRGRDSATLAVPIAAWLLAVHPDAASYATSGLETSAFCLLVVSGYALLTSFPLGAARAAAAGAVLAASTLTRPDGGLFAGLGLAYLLLPGRRGARASWAYALALAALLVPYLAWKLSYYGALLPNTYYAKSGYASWYSQGAWYLALYFSRYWVLALAPLLAVPVLWRGIRKPDPAGSAAARATGLALAFALAYAASIARVGGDFMFGRMLLPATPFLMLAIEHGVAQLTRGRTAARLATAAALALAVRLSPSPLHGPDAIHGIVDERAFYRATNRDSVRALGSRLARDFDGVPVRMAFTGGQAILARESRAEVALETSTGLTDRYIARQRLTRRGRVGHEKWTPLLYLIETRRADFVLFASGWLSDSVATYVPLVTGRIDGAAVTMLNWRPEVVDSLRARGAAIPDFPAILDGLIARLPALSEADVRRVYAMTRRFYFANTDDPARETRFRARLGVGAPPPR